MIAGLDEACSAMIQAANDLGVSLVSHPSSVTASLSEIHDPFDGVRAVVATWRSSSGVDGKVVIRDDGVLSGEYYVMTPHPTRPRWFIEAIDSWGNRGDLRVDARLVPMSDELRAVTTGG